MIEGPDTSDPRTYLETGLNIFAVVGVCLIGGGTVFSSLRLRVKLAYLRMTKGRRPMGRRYLSVRGVRRGVSAVEVTLILGLVLFAGTGGLTKLMKEGARHAGVVAGQIAREGTRLSPALGGWISMDPERGKAILRQSLPALAETGPDPPPRFGWQHTFRSWIFIALKYDLSQPRSLLLATLPRSSGELITFVQRAAPYPEEDNGTEPEGKSDAEDVARAEELSALPDVAHADTIALTKLRQNQWGNDPLVLIFHTHTSEMYAQEGYALTSPQDYHLFNSTETGITKVGEVLAYTLSTRYGIPLVHSKAIHDFPSYTQSYQRSGKTVQELLRKYPSIRVVLDVHRDGAENASFVRTVAGQQVAQVMVVVTKPGSYSERLHPLWQENVRFGRRIEQIMEDLYPGLLRRYPVVGHTRYNQNLHPNMVLLEVGTYADDERYALRSAALMADVIAVVTDEARKATVTPRAPVREVQSSPTPVMPQASGPQPRPQDTKRSPVQPSGNAPSPRNHRP